MGEGERRWWLGLVTVAWPGGSRQIQNRYGGRTSKVA